MNLFGTTWLHFQKQEMIQKLSSTRWCETEEELQVPIQLQISYWIPIYFVSESFKIQQLSICNKKLSTLYLFSKCGYWEFTLFICVGFVLIFLKNIN